MEPLLSETDHAELSACSPATTVITLGNSTACFSPFTDASAPSTVSSAPSSPRAVGDKHHQHFHESIDSIATGSSSITTPTTTDNDEDVWQHVADPKERRKIQNRIAQRKYSEYHTSTKLPSP